MRHLPAKIDSKIRDKVAFALGLAALVLIVSMPMISYLGRARTVDCSFDLTICTRFVPRATWVVPGMRIAEVSTLILVILAEVISTGHPIRRAWNRIRGSID